MFGDTNDASSRVMFGVTNDAALLDLARRTAERLRGGSLATEFWLDFLEDWESKEERELLVDESFFRGGDFDSVASDACELLGRREVLLLLLGRDAPVWWS
jgi:hypothetical protein